jgi:hypothetical protein
VSFQNYEKRSGNPFEREGESEPASTVGEKGGV